MAYDPDRKRPRILWEIATLVVAVLIAIFVARLAVVDTALVIVFTVIALVVARLSPVAGAPRWPVLRHPERGGRRAEIYRLSWGVVQRDGRVGVHAIRRLRAVVDETLSIAASSLTSADLDAPQRSALTTLRSLAAEGGPLESGTLSPKQFTAALAALDQLASIAAVGSNPTGGHRP